MKVWIVKVMDSSECCYEGDSPEFRVGIFSTKEKAKEYEEKENKQGMYNIYTYGVEEVEVE